MFILKNIWFILFIGWGLPLTFYRSKFRKIVYQTDSWTINIKPYFMKELKALFGNIYPDNNNYLKFRNFYRFYLIIYMLLFTSYLTYGQKIKMNEIKIGSSIPAFKLPDQNGNLFDINPLIGKKNLVIYCSPAG
jgi:thioredoxin-dependent peroxiredoxin